MPPRIYLVLFKLREGIVRNEKIVTAKMVTEPKSEKKKKSMIAFYTECSYEVEILFMLKIRKLKLRINTD